ncbi:MAG TPA: iron ABC transporter substrate-binding protein [Clostridia bacterium]|nr:iron ABC transporter substrate-binding protein [Clostridia bacterium]
MIKEKVLGIILVTALFLGGCAADVSTPAPAPGETRMVTDAFGRQVEIPQKVETVAAIGGAARILTYAGCADKLVGVTDMDKQNIAAMPYSVVNAAHFANLPSVGSGGANDTPYIEELVTLAPDVIIGLTDENTIKNVAEKTGIPTIGIYPEGMFDESFYAALALIGQVMGTEERSAKVIDFIKECQADLDRRTRDIPEAEKPTVYVGAVSFRGAHGFEGTHANYPPLTAIHAKNVADETGEQGAFIVDLEKVIVWDPDIIFLNPTNMDLVNDHYGKNKAFYQSLKAVQNGQVYTQISYNYNWTNMEIAIANAYYAGKVIYPERFTDIDPVEKADEIFTVLLGQPFYDRLARDGMRFEQITLGE